MLNHSCKKVLNCLIKLNTNNIEINGTKTFNEYLPNYILQDLDLILEYLYSNGYLTYQYFDDDIYSVTLTYKGLAYKSFNLEEFKLFISKSIIVPIIISIATTLLTMWLQRLL